MNFLEHITDNAVSYPETTAIAHGKTSITYWDLYMQIRNVAGSARKAGINHGSNVLFACKPDVESLTLALGLLYSGASLTILDPFSSNELFISRGVKAGVTHVVADPILYRISKHRNFAEKLLKKPVADILSLGVPTFSLGKYGDVENVKSWFRKREYKETFDTNNREAIIVFTSGTTSEPKGVVHTLESLSANIDDFIDIFEIEDGQRIYSEPMTLGLIALSAGATWIIPKNEKRIPNCDVWFGTPAEILAGLPKSRRSKIGIVSSGSAPVLPSLVKQIQKYHRKSRILCVYGMTEMLPIAVGDATKKLNFTDGDYIGEPLPKSEVEIIDGEVYVGGPALMDHYVGHEPTGMLLTGDYGRILPSGELVLLGRKKDMFIRGDMNVYPALYEPNISTIEGVNEVVLVGLPDKYGDDELILVVSPKPKISHKKLKREVSKKMFKFFDEKAIPSQVIVLDNIPKSGRANKIDRKTTTALVKKMKENGSW